MLVAASLSVNATGESGLCSLLVPLPSSPCLHHWGRSVLTLVSTFVRLCNHLSFHMGLISHSFVMLGYKEEQTKFLALDKPDGLMRKQREGNKMGPRAGCGWGVG